MVLAKFRMIMESQRKVKKYLHFEVHANLSFLFVTIHHLRISTLKFNVKHKFMMISSFIHLTSILYLIFDESIKENLRQTCFTQNESVCNDRNFSSSQFSERSLCLSLEKEVSVFHGYCIVADLTAFESTNLLCVF